VNLSIVSDAAFAMGRRFPSFPPALVRALPLPFVHAMRAPGLRETIRAARAAPFYAEAFRTAGIDSRCARPEDLGDFFLSSAVVKTQPESLLCGTPDLAIESSGTSGQVTRVYLSRRELEYNARQSGLLFGLWGLGRGDRLVCTLDYAWGLGALLVERSVRYLSLFAMVPGRISAEDAYDRIGHYGFNVIVSDPFWLARLTEIAAERGRPGPMKVLIGGGEGITSRARAELQRFWGAPVCMTYASTEAATVFGFECREQDGYHINEFDFHIDIDRPDADGYGEVILTTVNRRVMPLIRYRTGDIARWMPGRCACGLTFRRISAIRGRVDEQVSCAWGNVDSAFFERLLVTAEARVGDWQVSLYERELKPVFQFRVELGGDARVRQTTVQHVLTTLRSRHPDAWLAYCQRLVDIEFCFFEPGTLRHSRKLLRLIDERPSGPPSWVDMATRVGVAE
jgi:phenylacetate-coenzyme A ligase PaaK-like adenylate-forming protein